MVSDETGSPDTRFYIQTCIQPSPIQKKTFLFENETKLFSNKKFKSKTNLSYHILIMQRVYKFLITFLLLIFIDSVLF